MEKKPIPLRTRIYVDGYNLYYGCLKRTPYKWLDLNEVFNQILKSVLYERDGMPTEFSLLPLSIKFFTAPILKNFAKADDSVSSQVNYHDALRGHLGNAIEIIEGYYDAKPGRAPLYDKSKPPRDCEVNDIWKLEEKQSDVSLALHAYSDALRDEVDHVVIVTNDTDIAPALELIRAHTKAVVGLIVPARENVRKVNSDLEKLSDWTREHFVDHELASSQMPAMVRFDGRAIHKPLSWYPRPDLLMPIFEEAKRVKRSKGAALKWLNKPCAQLQNRIPMKMAETQEEAEELRAYMEKYAKEFGV